MHRLITSKFEAELEVKQTGDGTDRRQTTKENKWQPKSFRYQHRQTETKDKMKVEIGNFAGEG